MLACIAARISLALVENLPLCQTSRREESFLNTSCWDFSDTEITTRCIDPKTAWNHESGPSRSRKVGCGIKGPICFPFADLYFFYSRLNRSSLVRLITQKLYKSLENCII